MINAALLKLLDLQKIDQIIDDQRHLLESIPVEIDEKRGMIQQCLNQVEEEKKKLTNLQLKKKEKELEVQTQEEKIKKNEKELNAIKSNDAYRIMLSEIETSKKQKEQVEEEILNIMFEVDQTLKELKNFEIEAKQKQQSIESEIKGKEEEIKKATALLEEENGRRKEFVVQIPTESYERYDFIRNRKKTFAIATITGESCSGCNTILTPDTINQVIKGKELIICDSCARILYYHNDHKETPASTLPQPGETSS